MSVADKPLNTEDLTTFATRTREDRSRQAKRQARDRFGRWISRGASVQWRADNEDHAGIVQSIENGQAIVSVKGRKDLVLTLSPKDLHVTTSKATLSEKDIPQMAAEDTNKEATERPEFNEELETKGTASIKRDDGYVIEAQKEVDNDGNPIMYQLYAPNGRSLGIYAAEAINDFEKMIAEDKVTGPDKIINEEGEIVEISAESLVPAGPVAASAVVVRIARDNSAIIVKENNQYKIIETETGDILNYDTGLSTLLAGGSWRKAVGIEISPAAHFVSAEEAELAIKSMAQYRVPNNVKEAITAAARSIDTSNLSEDDLNHISALANDELVSLDSVKWITSFFSVNEEPEKLHGGYQGKKWATKILANQKDDEKEIIAENIVYSNFDDDTFAYFGLGNNTQATTIVNDLISIDLETDTVYKWQNGKFNVTELSIDSVEAPSVVVLDAETAKEFAKTIDSVSEFTCTDILDINPEERNLFTLAYSEIDFEEIDRLSTIIADATGYTPVERSVNAQRQKRGPGGRFGGEQVKQSSNLGANGIRKATLPVELPFVENINKVIADWIVFAHDFGTTVEASDDSTETTVASGMLINISNDDLNSFAEITPEDVMPTSTPEPTSAPTPTEDETVKQEAPEKTTDTDENAGNILYFAIVDPIDKTAVLDAIALIKKNGGPVAWVRTAGTWKQSPEKLSDLQGATPPPVVKLDVPEPVKSVLQQIDTHDTEKGIAEPVSASAVSFFDHTLSIFNENDLINSVFTLTGLPNSDYLIRAKQHVRKRARALNRMDLIPLEWREFSKVEIGIIENNISPLYGEYGEIITAGGTPGIADTPGDFRNVARLKNYWAFGKGAAKIRWGTPGDLTRAHRYLSKYVGPMRAWGLAQNLHKMVMGVSNTTHDIATGQYRGRGRKR